MSVSEAKLRQLIRAAPRSEEDLLTLLDQGLGWPLPADVCWSDVELEWEPEELHLDPEKVASLTQISQIPPLSKHQKFGVFVLAFGGGSLPIGAVRRLVQRLVRSERTRKGGGRIPQFELNDLLFFCLSADSYDALHIVGFREAAGKRILKVLSWGAAVSETKLDLIVKRAVPDLRWVGDGPSIAVELDSAHGFAGYREPIRNAEALSSRMAEVALELKSEVLALYEVETDDGPLRTLFEEFRSELLADLTVERFADVYAQTMVYGLFTARIAHPEAFKKDDVASLIQFENPLLNEIYARFRDETDGEIDVDELGLADLSAQLSVTDVESVVADFGAKNRREDPVVHFYEKFLEKYDPGSRIAVGAFYTPLPIVRYLVRAVDSILKDSFGLALGVADPSSWAEVSGFLGMGVPKGIDPQAPFVSMLDPATGTGTFLVEWVQQAERSFRSVRPKGDWPRHLTNFVFPSMHAFELMLAPYAIAHLRIALMARENKVRMPAAMILLTDSLEYPSDQPHIAELGDPVAEEGERAGRLKRDAHFTTIIGNPPYRRARDRGGDFGGWVRHSSADGKPALMDSFIEPLRVAGKGSAANTLHELSVYFWRWALWKIYEQVASPGIISFITPRAFLSSPGHAGMRQVLRERFDEMWLLDLGGDNRGAAANESDNVFDIETGVCITVGARYGGPSSSEPAKAHYALVDGTRNEKLKSLEEEDYFDSREWIDCPTDWQAALIGVSEGLFQQWPDIRDLFPWQISGSQFKRLWPIGESTEVLEERWRKLLSLDRDGRRVAYRETRDRLAGGAPSGSRDSKRFTGIEVLSPKASCPTPIPYSFRALDRQWALYDDRLGDFIRETLYAIRSDKQVFFSTLMTKRLGEGPAITATELLPDLDFFCNRGAADIIALYRDPAGSEPNITPGLCSQLSRTYGFDVSPEDVYAYVTAIMFGPEYVARFSESLRTPGPRIPITKSANLFREAVVLGKRFVWLQTYGHRWTPADEKRGRLPRYGFKVVRAVPADEDSYPESYSYDPSTQSLHVGGGTISGVSMKVWGYEQSKWRVVERWLAYRMRVRAGRAGDAGSSVLDSIRPRCWSFTDDLLDLLRVVQGCVDMWPSQAELLEKICAADTFRSSELPMPKPQDRLKPQVVGSQQASLYE